MDKEALEQILKSRCHENAICKILSIESSPAVEKFRNFLSTVNRLKMKVVLGNGRLATRYLISKEAQVAEAMSKIFIVRYDPFQTEIMMYETVLKEMEYLMDEFEDTDDILWCDMVHFVRYKTIILDDLLARGFTMTDKTFFFDLDHSLMTFRALAKFHALSKVLESRGIVKKDNFKPWNGFSNVQMQQMGLMAFKATLEGIKLYWGPQWSSIVDKINVSPEMLQTKMKKLGEVELPFNVLNHGDCNKNNIMFKYGWNKRPIAIKLLDYQLSFYGSPCLDLNYVLYCCLDPKVRRANYDLFVKAYHESLCSILDQYKFAGDKPSLEELMEGLEAFSFQGYWFFLSFYPTMCLGDEMEKYIDVQKVLSTGGREGYNFEVYKVYQNSLIENFGPDFEIFANKYF